MSQDAAPPGKGENLAVIVAMFNPWGYAAIVDNMRRFVREMEATAGVTLFIIECAFAARPFEVTSANDYRHIQVRTNSPAWIKENCQDIAFRYVHREFPAFSKVVFVDGDLTFLAEDWVDRTRDSLDHHAMVQPWNEAVFGGPKSEFCGTVSSFMSRYVAGDPWSGHPPTYGSMWHPGYASAWQADALEAIGGLLDINMVGGADLEMALGLIGRMDAALEHQGITPGSLPAYEAACYGWQDRCNRVIRGNVGVVDGMVRHHHHGSQQGRQYSSRYEIPLRHGFNPNVDLIRNRYGVYEWAPHVTGMKYDVRGMFARRKDDGG